MKASPPQKKSWGDWISLISTSSQIDQTSSIKPVDTIRFNIQPKSRVNPTSPRFSRGFHGVFHNNLGFFIIQKIKKPRFWVQKFSTSEPTMTQRTRTPDRKFTLQSLLKARKRSRSQRFLFLWRFLLFLPMFGGYENETRTG